LSCSITSIKIAIVATTENYELKVKKGHSTLNVCCSNWTPR
jgi:hypothetical protein